MNKEFRGKNRGITLIALVITIIVLLILAGISISMLTGENGILNQAVNSAVLTDISGVTEEVRLDIVAKQMENNNYDGITEEEYIEILEKYGSLEYTDTVIDGTLTTKKGNKIKVSDIYDKIITSLHYITAQDVLDDPAMYYGKVIETGGEQGDLQEDYEWEIFYSDGTNIYLIAKDYINYQDAPSKDGVAISHSSSSIYKQNCYWSSSLYRCYSGYKGINNYEHSDDYCWNLLFCGRYEDKTCTNTNAKCVSYMLDHEIWEDKFNGQFQEGAVEYIIGGSTVEKFCQAYNEYHDAGGCSCGSSGDLGCLVESSSSSYGYKVSLGDSTNYYQYTNCSSCEDCNFLFIRDTSKANSMWLASPCGVNTICCLIAANNGNMNYVSYDGTQTRVSPASLSKIYRKIIRKHQ